jgi:hypothetical protein
MMPSGPPPLDFEDLEFETIEESWNEYDLPNQTRVRGKFVALRIFKDKRNPDPNALGLSGQNLFVVTAPIEQRGPASIPLTLEELQRTDYPRINPITSNEKWNRYRISKSGIVIKVRLVLNEVYRIQGKYDNDGMPMYIFNSAQMVVPDKHGNSNIRR